MFQVRERLVKLEWESTQLQENLNCKLGLRTLNLTAIWCHWLCHNAQVMHLIFKRQYDTWAGIVSDFWRSARTRSMNNFEMWCVTAIKTPDCLYLDLLPLVTWILAAVDPRQLTPSSRSISTYMQHWDLPGISVQGRGGHATRAGRTARLQVS